MPARSDRVTIALDSGDVDVTWLGRQVLIGRLQAAPEIRAAFAAVGAGGRVELTSVQHAELLNALEQWALAARGGFASLPTEVIDLRNALMSDLNDSGRQQAG